MKQMLKRVGDWWWWVFHTRSRVEAAWARIVALEKQAGRLDADLDDVEEAVSVGNGRIEALEKQLADLRRIVTAQPPKAAPFQARTFREVRDFVAGGDDAV